MGRLAGRALRERGDGRPPTGAFRSGVPPKVGDFMCTKIINREIFACFAPRKQVRVCKFHSFGGVFCFLLYTRAQKRASPTALTRGMAPQVGELERQAGGGWLARGGGGGKLTASSEASRRCFTLGSTAAHNARRPPAPSPLYPRWAAHGFRV